MEIRIQVREASHSSHQKYEIEKSNQQAGCPGATRPVRTTPFLPLKGKLSHGTEDYEAGRRTHQRDGKGEMKGIAQRHAQAETDEAQDTDQGNLEGPPPAKEHLIHPKKDCSSRIGKIVPRRENRHLCRKWNPIGARRRGAKVRQQEPPI